MGSIPSISTTVRGELSQIEPIVLAALAAEGFGILTEVDMAGVLKAKIGVERGPLKILGACNPQLANQAIEIDASAALLLPCNVVLEQINGRDGPLVYVAAADPRMLLPGESHAPVTIEAAARLEAAIRSVAAAALKLQPTAD